MGFENTIDKSFIRHFQSPANMASGIATIFLAENPNDLCDTINLIIRERQAGIDSTVINEEILAITDKLSDYESISF